MENQTTDIFAEAILLLKRERLRIHGLKAEGLKVVRTDTPDTAKTSNRSIHADNGAVAS